MNMPDIGSPTVLLELTIPQFECILSRLDELEYDLGPLDDEFYAVMNYLIMQYRLKTNKNPYSILF